MGPELQAMYLGIIGSVADNEEALGAHDASQPVQKAGRSDASGKRDDRGGLHCGGPCRSMPVMRKPECLTRWRRLSEISNAAAFSARRALSRGPASMPRTP